MCVLTIQHPGWAPHNFTNLRIRWDIALLFSRSIQIFSWYLLFVIVTTKNSALYHRYHRKERSNLVLKMNCPKLVVCMVLHRCCCVALKNGKHCEFSAVASGLQSEPWTLAKDDKGCHKGSGNRKIGVKITAHFRRQKSDLSLFQYETLSNAILFFNNKNPLS